MAVPSRTPAGPLTLSDRSTEKPCDDPSSWRLLVGSSPPGVVLNHPRIKLNSNASLRLRLTYAIIPFTGRLSTRPDFARREAAVTSPLTVQLPLYPPWPHSPSRVLRLGLPLTFCPYEVLSDWRELRDISALWRSAEAIQVAVNLRTLFC